MHRSTFGSGFGVEFSDRAWGLGGRSRVQDLRSRLQGSRKLEGAAALSWIRGCSFLIIGPSNHEEPSPRKALQSIYGVYRF